jgi:hypothetical protein
MANWTASDAIREVLTAFSACRASRAEQRSIWIDDQLGGNGFDEGN